MTIRSEIERLVSVVDEEDEVFQRYCDRVEDWDRAFGSAFEHGVAGVLVRRLASAGVAVPAPALKDAERRLAIDRLWHRRLAAELQRLLAAFESSGLRAVALKGPLLAERLYPEAWMRASGDLDLLVRPAELSRASRVLEHLGFGRRPGPSPRHAEVFDLPGGATVDLHHGASAGFGTALHAVDLVDRAVVYRPAGGETAWILAPEDELIYLAVHAARHRFLRLRWLYDLRLFVQSRPGLDWAEVAGRARALGVARAVTVAGEVLEGRLEGSWPEAAREHLGRAERRSGWALAVAARSDFRPRGLRQRGVRLAWHVTYQALLGEGLWAAVLFWCRSMSAAAGKLGRL